MVLSKPHLMIRVIFLCVMFLYSTGFTYVVRYCSMSQSSECCCNSAHDGATPAQSRAHTITAQYPSCFTVKVLGGLNDVKGVVSAEFSGKSTIAFAVALEYAAIPQQVPALSLAPVYTGDLPPPLTDIYLRVGTLLI
jgi:hypothetical protein